MPETAITKEQKKTLWFVISASSVGTLIEWYDFYIFGSLATILSEQFFPKGNPTAAFLSTLATFAAGFIVRPFGAIVYLSCNAHPDGRLYVCDRSCPGL
jgi:MHS family proline/betaine transporter-like MFS transporter